MNWNVYSEPNSYLGCAELLGHVEAGTAEEAVTKGREKWGDKVYRVNGKYQVAYADQFIVRCDGGQPLIE